MLHKITPSIRTPFKFAPVRSALLKFVGGILASISLLVVLAIPYSYPHQKKVAEPGRTAVYVTFIIEQSPPKPPVAPQAAAWFLQRGPAQRV